MEKLREIGCRWTTQGCQASVEDEEARVMKRQNVAPDGQVLPDWLTWSPYETTIDDQVIQTGEILQLPLTYYGPSIPLGPDWTYGGLTSPAPGEAPPPTSTSISLDEAEPTQTVSATSEGLSPTNEQTVDTVSSGGTGSEGSSEDTGPEETVAFRTGAGPASPLGQVIPPLTVTPSYASPSVISPSPLLSSGASTTSNIDITSHPPSSSTAPFSPETEKDDLIPLLPAILVPLLVAIILILLVIWFFRRRSRSRQGYTTAIGASSGGYGGWLTSSFAKRANGSGDRFTSAWTQVNDTGSPVGGVSEKTTKQVSPVSPVSAAEWAKSNERSALLGFISQHHRASSSIDHAQLSGEGTKNESTMDEKKEEAKEEELEVLADRNQSLLGRLNLGIGWLSVASLSSVRSRTSGSGNAQSRVASGHTLERGNGGVGALGRPKSQGGSGGSGTGTPAGSGSNDQSGSGAQNTNTSDSAALNTEISTDQLFFRAPLDTASLSSSHSPSPRRGFFARWKAGGAGGSTSSKSKGSSGPSRRSWVSSHIVVEGDEDEPLNQTLTQEGISIAMPITPSTLGEGDKEKTGAAAGGRKATRWDSKEKLKFPVPPSGGASSGEKESLISSHNTEYHSAESNYSAPSAAPTPEPIITTNLPFDKAHSDYAQPALSPFGSRESISPAKVVAGRAPAHSTTQGSGTSMRDLFPASPSGRPSIDSGGGGDRVSYVGHPIIDDTLLQAISTGRGTYSGLGGIDEFGQTVRAVSGEAPTIVSTGRWSRSHESEMASYHSGPSTGSSHSTGPREILAESDEATIRSHALRGRRSQPQLIQAPVLARLTPTPISRTSSDSEHSPMTWTRRWGG